MSISTLTVPDAGFAAPCFGDTFQDSLDLRIGLPSAPRNVRETASLRGWGVSATTAAEKMEIADASVPNGVCVSPFPFEKEELK
jgi:hypothetical protein